MVRKEIWVHLLAYNLIRTLMAQTALQTQCIPRELSFKACLQTLNAFASQLKTATERQARKILQKIYSALSTQRVGKRKGRSEPRAVKRRPKPYPRLKTPRNDAKKNTTKSNNSAEKTLEKSA